MQVTCIMDRVSCITYKIMHRFFCEPQNITSHQIKIQDKVELHHLKDVLRLKDQDKIVVLDGNGSEFLCKIAHLDKKCAKLKIIKKRIHKKEEFLPKITIACALPKKSKIDFIVEKLTEIGVDKIILLKTERTEVNLKDFSKKLFRLKKIAESALKQSGNLFLPEISSMSFKELLEIKRDHRYDLAIIPNLSSDTKSLKDILVTESVKSILVTIGPEGDFSEREMRLAKQSGFVSVSLGRNVLKVDTAAIVTAGFIKLYQGQTPGM